MWADGVKQTLNPDGTNAGFNVGAHTADPSALVNGDGWYQSTANELRFRINGVTATIAGLQIAQTFTVDQIFNTAITAGNTLFNVTATTGVLRLGNGTDPAANPTNATTQWAVGGEWQYRSSATAEGAGQTNRVHNRADKVVGAGTDYTLTTAYARVDFGTTDPEIVLPTAGTYLIIGMFQFIASVASANDVHGGALWNSTDSAFVGHGAQVSLGASFNGAVSVSQITTVTASKTIQLYAINISAARGVVQAGNSSIRYIRLS